jgi:hypothetical protein
MITIFHSHRLLNPKEIKNSEKIFNFRQIFEVWCFHQSSNLMFVVSKWSQRVTWKSRRFSASERGDFWEEIWDFTAHENGVILGISLSGSVRSGWLAGLVQEDSDISAAFIIQRAYDECSVRKQPIKLVRYPRNKRRIR